MPSLFRHRHVVPFLTVCAVLAGCGDCIGCIVEEGPPRDLFTAPKEERTKQFLAHFKYVFED